MTIRELPQATANRLVEIGHNAFRMARDGWQKQRATPPQKTIYERAFSDGVKATLEILTQEGIIK